MKKQYSSVFTLYLRIFSKQAFKQAVSTLKLGFVCLSAKLMGGWLVWLVHNIQMTEKVIEDTVSENICGQNIMNPSQNQCKIFGTLQNSHRIIE